MVVVFLSRLKLPIENEEMIDDQILDKHIFFISMLYPWFFDI